MAYTNNRQIPLPIAVWLARDLYDRDPTYISGSELQRSNRQIVLSRRVAQDIDLSQVLAARLGNAINDAIDAAWKSQHLMRYVRLAGFNPLFEYEVNPTDPTPGKTPIYIQKRYDEPFMNGTLSGAPDLILNGRLTDYKSTSVFLYMKKTPADYIWQLTTYRYLARQLISDDTATIQFILKDWSKARADKDVEYPQTPCPTLLVRVGSAEQCKQRLESRITELDALMLAEDADLPLCTDEELWLDPPRFAYYTNPHAPTTGRATRVFDTMPDALAYQATKSGAGRIDTRKGEAKACEYCSASTICQQRLSLNGI
jgi:hypothetical protein